MSNEEKEEFKKVLREELHSEALSVAQKHSKRSGWDLGLQILSIVCSLAIIGGSVMAALAYGVPYANLPKELEKQGKEEAKAIEEVKGQVTSLNGRVQRHDEKIGTILSEQQRLGQLAQDTHDDVKQVKDLLLQATRVPILK